MRMMVCASNDLDRLLDYREEFAGIPGQTEENREKRKRLDYFLYPGC